MQKPVDGPLRGDQPDADIHHQSLDRPLYAALARITGGAEGQSGGGSPRAKHRSCLDQYLRSRYRRLSVVECFETVCGVSERRLGVIWIGC